MKKFVADFKKFISKGNILDMAVGVIVGNAFSAIVKSFTDKIIMPLINYLLLLVTGGEEGLSSIYTFLKKSYDSTTGAVDLANSIYIDWGAFITAVLNFFIIALTLFIVLRVAMKSNEFLKKTSDNINKAKLTKADRIELKKRKISLTNKKALDEYRKEKAEKAKKEKAEKEAAAKAKAAADRLANPTTEDLLKDIRDLLKATVPSSNTEKKAEEQKN